MQRGLVGAKLNLYAVGSKTLPKVNHISEICQRHGLAVFASLEGACYKLVERSMHLVDPALAAAGFHCFRIYLGNNSHHARYVARLGLRSRHSAETGSDK